MKVNPEDVVQAALILERWFAEGAYISVRGGGADA